MTTIQSYTLTREDLSFEINRGIDAFLALLVAEKKLTPKERDNYISTYRAVIVKKGLFGKAWAELTKNGETFDFIKIIKLP